MLLLAAVTQAWQSLVRHQYPTFPPMCGGRGSGLGTSVAFAPEAPNSTDRLLCPSVNDQLFSFRTQKTSVRTPAHWGAQGSANCAKVTQFD